MNWAASLPALGVTLAPVAAEAFERALPPPQAAMEACPREGAGFARIPGTTTCLRVSGRARAAIDAGSHRTGIQAEGRFAIDSRSESDLGPVRSFVRIDAGRH